MSTLHSDAAPKSSDIEAALRQAIELHRAGNIEQAERLYRAILSERPNHPDASHNLGVLAMQTGHTASALTHFKAALEANPNQGQYWLSTIDALFEAGQPEAAHELLEQGRKHGLAGEAVEALARHLHVSGKVPRSQSSPPQSPGTRQRRPNPKEMSKLVALFHQGSYAEAEQLARSLTTHFPRNGFGWKALGVVLHQQGRLDEALTAKQRAAELLPGDAEAHINFGNALLRVANFAEAEASYRKALQLTSDSAELHLSLGITLQRQNLHHDAETYYRRAIELNPNLAEAHSNLAAVLNSQGRLTAIEAEAAYRRIVAIDPNLAEAHCNLAGSLHQQGKFAEAEAASRQAIAIAPRLIEAHTNLASSLQHQGRYDEADTFCRHALEIDPNSADAHNNLGAALRERGRYAEAETSYSRAMELNPNLAEAHSNLATLLIKRGCFAEAEAACRVAIELKPDFAEAMSALANILQETGRLAEAELFCRQALAAKPGLMESRSLLLYCLAHNPSVGPEALFAEHLRFAEQYEAPLRARWPRHTNSRDRNRRLNIGFVSADLRDHAVALFLEPVLLHLANSPDFVFHAYSNHPTEDAVTRRLRRHFGHWTSVVGISDDALAENILEDRIDILIDLSGHTAGHRLLTFARKPAPIQASWIGYPGTTGLDAMAYYLADRFFLPLDRFAAHFTEKIVHLPAVSPFRPPESAPPINPLPALANGYVTFASFNRLAKINPIVVALWSQLLSALPASRMLVGAIPQASYVETLRDSFAAQGIAAERLHFHPRTTLERYRALHNEVDLCLDTFPYGGCTTTTQALWMGVPTLSFAGATPAGREGAAFLSHLGLHGFLAESEADFLRKGLDWASRLNELADLRATMRDRFQHSALGHPEIIASGFAKTLRTIWHRWCAGLPPEAF